MTYVIEDYLDDDYANDRISYGQSIKYCHHGVSNREYCSDCGYERTVAQRQKDHSASIERQKSKLKRAQWNVDRDTIESELKELEKS